jgi:hypothetical protein
LFGGAQKQRARKQNKDKREQKIERAAKEREESL